MRITDCWVPAERTITSRRERTVLCPRARQDLHLFEAVTAPTKHAPVNQRHPHRLSSEAPRIQDQTHMHENNLCTHVYEQCHKVAPLMYMSQPCAVKSPINYTAGFVNPRPESCSQGRTDQRT